MAEQATTARPTRAEQHRRERRLKPGALQHAGRRLSVDESGLDRKQFEYRWVRDVDGRVKALEDQDWDVVNDLAAAPEANGVSTVRDVHGGREENGKPFRQVLMRKYKDWYETDQKTKQAPLERIDQQLRRGKAQEIAAETDKDLGDHAYTPGAGNSIEVKAGIRRVRD